MLQLFAFLKNSGRRRTEFRARKVSSAPGVPPSGETPGAMAGYLGSLRSSANRAISASPVRQGARRPPPAHRLSHFPMPRESTAVGKYPPRLCPKGHPKTHKYVGVAEWHPKRSRGVLMSQTILNTRDFSTSLEMTVIWSFGKDIYCFAFLDVPSGTSLSRNSQGKEVALRPPGFTLHLLGKEAFKLSSVSDLWRVLSRYGYSTAELQCQHPLTRQHRGIVCGEMRGFCYGICAFKIP
jgi:hypothetical protein